MSIAAEQIITEEVIDEAYTYEEYREMIDELLEQDKTTGDNHSDEMVHYTKMNVQRMSRWDKRAELTDSLVDELDNLDQKWMWLVVTEAWCGDAAQNIPGLVKIAEETENIDIRFILRDQNLDIMDEYLTNGGRSIPKLICLDSKTLEEVGTWGPRPELAQQKAMKWKEDESISKEEWAKKLHKWYAKNRNQELQKEFKQLISEWK
ncbi:thioredoxin family protein [Aliifodinibius salipaludis]|uniref:Thioredoxin family protein n=1 Tax=Fodinibius salipaludis TaxID=2032627 RepID=A0A2A2G9P3_9BACT|nr:thioredoxin family protein [Aliifodinibius salipaludis]PAU93573.1 thioredoxin family protein [Aliifodinibius salipaludis]